MTPRRFTPGAVGRREFLRLAGAATGGLFVAGACAPAAQQPPATTAPTIAPTATAPAAAAAAPRHGGRVTVAFPGTPNQFDPALLVTQEEYAVIYGSHNGLVWVDANLTPQPELAERWTFSEDLSRWDFKLREGVRFHHGTELTSEDVVFTFQRILDPDLGSPMRSVMAFLDRVEALDEHSVRFHLNSPNADLPIILGAPHNRVVAHDRTDAQLALEPSGTGPFRLTDLEPGSRARMKRSEEYWEEDLPYLDEVRFLYMPEEATQLAAIQGGSADIMWQLGFENIPQIERMPGVQVAKVRSGLYQPIVFRVTDEPFTDARVREAMKLVADRPGIRQVVSQGLGDLGNDQPIAPVNPFWADLPVPEQNIQKARELLAEAGFADGLKVTLHTTAGRPGLVEQAIAFQEMAKPAGIQVEIKRVPADVYWGETWMKVPLFMSNWTFRASTDETVTITYHSQAKWNEHNWQSPELDALIEQARAESDQARRAELYADVQRMLKEEGGVLVAYFKPIVMAIRDEVKGFQPHPSAWVNLRDTWITESA